MFEPRERPTRPTRERRVSFPIDNDEYWMLKQAAKNAGLSASAFIRMALGRVINRDTGAAR